jgi:hypothetical protein
LHRSGGDICNKADEVKTSHRVVSPGLTNVLERGRLFDGRQALGRVIAKKPVDHDNLLAFTIPFPRAENALCLHGRLRQIEKADESDEKGQRSSRGKSQNQPGLPSTPRMLRMPAASRADITRATLRVDQKTASRVESSRDL